MQSDASKVRQLSCQASAPAEDLVREIVAREMAEGAIYRLRPGFVWLVRLRLLDCALLSEATQMSWTVWQDLAAGLAVTGFDAVLRDWAQTAATFRGQAVLGMFKSRRYVGLLDIPMPARGAA